jgi:hydrogenase/urease accessory protein HupE
MALTVIFSIAIGMFTIPMWLPINSGRQLPTTYWAAVVALTFSSLLQIVFNVCVDTELIPLAYSLRFAAVGAPCCLIAMLLAIINSPKANESRRVIGCAIAGLTMWLIFTTLH